MVSYLGVSTSSRGRVGYHVCEVRIQGLFLHFPITFISGSFQFSEHQSDQKWQKVSRFFFKNQSFRVTTKMP